MAGLREGGKDQAEQALRHQRRRALDERDAAERVSSRMRGRHFRHDALGGRRGAGGEREQEASWKCELR